MATPGSNMSIVSIHASVKDATFSNTVLDYENTFQSTHL